MSTGPQDPKIDLLERIRDDLKQQDELKRDVLAGLKPVTRWSRLLEAAKHPFVLLLAGSIVGAWITSRYQTGEWYRQQQTLQHRQQVEQKIIIRDQVVDALIQSHSAAQSAVRPLFYENGASFKAKEGERGKEWDKENHAWQVAESRIQQKLALYFKDVAAQAKFKQIIECHNENDKANNTIFIEVNNVLNIVRKNPKILNENGKTDFERQSKELRDLKTRVRQNILGPIERVRVMTKELLQTMQSEIERDLSSQKPPSFWSLSPGILMKFMVNHKFSNTDFTINLQTPNSQLLLAAPHVSRARFTSDAHTFASRRSCLN